MSDYRILFDNLDFSTCIKITSTCKVLRKYDTGNWRLFNEMRNCPTASKFMSLINIYNQGFMAELTVFLFGSELEQIKNCCWSFPVLERINRRKPREEFKIKYIVMHYIKCMNKKSCQTCEKQDASFMKYIITEKQNILSSDDLIANTIRSNIVDIINTQDIELFSLVEKFGLELSRFVVYPELRLTRFLYIKSGVLNNIHAGYLLNYPEGNDSCVLKAIKNIDFIFGDEERIIRWLKIHKPLLNIVIRWFFSVNRDLNLEKILALFNKNNVVVDIKFGPNIKCLKKYIHCISNVNEVKMYIASQ